MATKKATKTKTANRKDLPVLETKNVSRISKTIDVDGKSKEITVIIDVNAKTGTYKVSTSLATKNIHPSNEDVNDATFATITEMLRQGVDHARNEERKIKENIQPDDPNQMGMGFEDED